MRYVLLTLSLFVEIAIREPGKEHVSKEPGTDVVCNIPITCEFYLAIVSGSNDV